MHNIIKEYYIKNQREKETLEETINRVDYEIQEANFKYLSDRDTVNNELIEWQSKNGLQ